MTTNGTVEQEPNSGYPRLEHQIAWYDAKSGSAQTKYKLAKYTEIICAAIVPAMAATNAGLTATFGAIVLILESIQQLNQWSQNWVTYRSTCEALRHEKYSYLSYSGAYDEKSPEEAKKILAQRVESLVSTEHSKWISRQEYESKRPIHANK